MDWRWSSCRRQSVVILGNSGIYNCCWLSQICRTIWKAGLKRFPIVCLIRAAEPTHQHHFLYLVSPASPPTLCQQDLRGDGRLVREAIAQNAMALQFASEGLQSQRDLVLAAVVKHGHALQFASDRLKEDTADKLLLLNVASTSGCS